MRSARAHRVPCGCATRPRCECGAGSSSALRVRHASWVRVPSGLTGCPAGAPRVPGASAARAHRVPCGCATRPRCECSAGLSSALRVRHASWVRVPRGLSGCPAGAPRVPGASAARAHRVPPGCAPRPSSESARMTSWRVQPDGDCPKDPAERTLVRLKAVPGLPLCWWALWSTACHQPG